MLRILIVCVLLFCGPRVEAVDGITTFLSHAFKKEHSTLIIKADRRCKCRNICYASPKCKMISAVKLDDETFECRITDEAKSYLLDETTSDDVSWIVDLERSCKAPFKAVDGVGCIAPIDDTGPFSEAEEKCPEDSRLYSPGSLAMYEKMADYLMEQRENRENTVSGDNYWAGIQRNSSKAWVWYYSGKHIGNGVAVPPGTYPFGGVNPNDDTDCASIHYNLFYKFSYHLADTQCHNQYRVLCQLW